MPNVFAERQGETFGVSFRLLASYVYTMYTRDMKTVIRTWGNSLAVRIPKVFAVDMGIGPGKEVELSLEPDGLHIASRGWHLNALLGQVTPENLHGEVQTGSAVGKEAW